MAEASRPEPPGDNPLLQAYFEKRPNLVRFFAARTGSLAAAEDLAQDLYLKIAARPSGDEVSSPGAMLYRMAANLMMDRARGERRTAVREAAWRQATRDTEGGEDLAEEPPADEAVAARQRLRQLVEAVSGLPPQMQRAFRLHKLEGLSHAQTAQQMGISAKAVEKHISAALKALARKLAP